jgi:preprotein translocase subunit SecA
MLKKFIRIIGGDPNKREVDKFSDVVDQINALEPELELLSDEALRLKTDEFRLRLAEARQGIDDETELRQAEQDALEDLLPEAYATVREASKRTIGLRHFDVQMIGGMALHHGKIAEMRTGEGKTLVATLPMYLNALTGRGVHLITVNDYLARRDARWMAPIFNLLGMSVGVLQIAARTENGKKAFLVDLEKESPHEDQHQLRLVPRGEAYQADITYGMNSEFGFDYLRDNMTMRWEDRVQRGHYFAIVDEVDNVLIDEARTPLIISGPAQDEGEWYIRMAQIVKALRPEDYEINEKDRNVTLTELGEGHIEELLEMPLRDPDRPEDVTPEQARLMGYLEQAMRAQYLFKRNKDYLVQAGKVIIVDEFTGRMMPGRRWSDGLHQAVEAKEGVKVQSESVTYATVTIQNYFRMYQKLAGMSGTALTEAEEFDKIYKLGVLAIPTNLEYQAARSASGLVELEGRDDQGYKFNYYARNEDALKAPVFWRRKDYPDVIYRSQEIKLRMISQEILRYHVLGRPMLVGTTSVELSERLSGRLRAEPLRRLAQTLLLREAYIRVKDIQEDGRQIPELQFLYTTPLADLDIGVLRKMARDLDLIFNPEDPANLARLLGLLDLPETHLDRLAADLSAGIPHQVLNARKHTEESQIIASAGAFGAVTIATNMAGRGVDIKLGGELAEEIIASVNRVLSRAGYRDPYDMTLQERHQALLEMDRSAYGIYETEIDFFFKHMEEMEQVRALGGLHVIGSERHEARRIDNQLRGRAARQGDPGSSRFYLSMEDDLMRLFGGQQAEGLMQRLKVDESLPLEVGLVGRLIEQSQTRVEGSNFDVRKHLLEYDDVLNTQRARIYGERDRIFHKDDLTEDVTGMLRTELARRVPEALKDEGGPWKLIAWLDQVQPPIQLGSRLHPSFSLKILQDHIMARLAENPSVQTLRQALSDVVNQALDAEASHHLQVISETLEQSQERLETQIEERLEAVDTFFEGLTLDEESGTRRPADLLNELSGLARLPIKLSNEEQRLLKDDPASVAPVVREQVEAAMYTQAISRLIGAIERRVDEVLEANLDALAAESWTVVSETLLAAAESALQKRRERYLGEAGQITKDLDAMLERLPPNVSEQTILALLMQLPQGSRALFDRRTHRRIVQRTTRLTYMYAAARYLEDQKPDQIAEDVLDHLEGAQQAIRNAWGQVEFARLNAVNFADIDADARRSILEALGYAEDPGSLAQPLTDLPAEQKAAVADELGRRALTGIYRQLLLSVITELWVEYLTQMEALRVSIGLEAYAQRDPLVQYKSRAAELYQNLQKDIRMGVVTRMFTYRPRDLSQVQVAVSRAEAPALQVQSADALAIEAEVEYETAAGEEIAAPEPAAAQNEGPAALERSGGKKRKRHRR